MATLVSGPEPLSIQNLLHPPSLLGLYPSGVQESNHVSPTGLVQSQLSEVLPLYVSWALGSQQILPNMFSGWLRTQSATGYLLRGVPLDIRVILPSGSIEN